MAKVHFFIENSKIKRYVIKDCDIINLNSFIFKWGHILFPVLTIINWVLTYFRLKESEVIHRM